MLLLSRGTLFYRNHPQALKLLPMENQTPTTPIALKPQYEITTLPSGEKVAVRVPTAEQEALMDEQEGMGRIAQEMWVLMEEQKPGTFKSMRKNKTLVPYLIRLEDQHYLKVQMSHQEGTRIFEAVEMYMQEMREERGVK